MQGIDLFLLVAFLLHLLKLLPVDFGRKIADVILHFLDFAVELVDHYLVAVLVENEIFFFG